MNTAKALVVAIAIILATPRIYFPAQGDSPKTRDDAMTMQAPPGFTGIHLGMTVREFISLRKAAKSYDQQGKAHLPQLKKSSTYGNGFFTEQINTPGFIREVQYWFLNGRLHIAFFSSETRTKPLTAKMEEMILQGVQRYGVPSQVALQGDSTKVAIVLWRRKNGSSFIRFDTDYYETRASQSWGMILGNNSFIEDTFGKFRTPTVGDEKYILGPVRRALAKAGHKYNVAIPAPLLKPPANPSDPRFSVDPKARELFAKASNKYRNVTSLSLQIKTRDFSPEPQSYGTGVTNAWLQRPNKVRVEFKGEERRLYIMDGNFMYHGTAIGSGGGYEKRAMRSASSENPDPAAGYIGLIGIGIGEVLEQLLQGKFIFAERAEAGEDEYLKGSKVEYLPPRQFGKNILEGFRIRSLYGKERQELTEIVAWFDTNTNLLARTQYRDQDRSVPQQLTDEIVDTQLNPDIKPETFIFRPEKGVAVIEPQPFVFPKP